MTVDEQIVRAQLWDSSQQLEDEKSNSFSYRFYRSANAIVFVYDVTRLETFQSLQHMYSVTSKFCHPGLPILFVGNKIDLHVRKVSKSDIKLFTGAIKNVTLAEISALKNTGLRDTLNRFIQKLIRDGPVPETSKTLALLKEPESTSPSIKNILCSCWT